MFRIIMIGPQGSGKGTQAELLSKKLHIPTYSAGQLYREEIAKGTTLGRRAKKVVETGTFMPTKDTNALMKKYLTPSRCRRGVILDGYPRTLEQVKANDKFCPPSVVLFINLSDAEAVRRLSARRVCPNCNANYHLKFAPPKRKGACDRCGGRLIRRLDDAPAAIRKRLRHFHREVMPVIRAFRKRGIVHSIDAAQSIEKVHEDIMKVLRVQ